jgi:GNAT superfamily N-acetyltransferase
MDGDATAAQATADDVPRGAAPPRPEGGVTVRLARDAADVEAIMALGRLFHAEGPYFRGQPYDEDRLRAFGRRALATGNPGGIMAERDGQLVGIAVVAVGEQFYSGTMVATVQLLYVRPEARGGASAVKLLRAIRRWSAAAGADDLHLHVTSAIAPAKTDRFLRRMGFRQTGGNYVLEGIR